MFQDCTARRIPTSLFQEVRSRLKRLVDAAEAQLAAHLYQHPEGAICPTCDRLREASDVAYEAWRETL